MSEPMTILQKSRCTENKRKMSLYRLQRVKGQDLKSAIADLRFVRRHHFSKSVMKDHSWRLHERTNFNKLITFFNWWNTWKNIWKNLCLQHLREWGVLPKCLKKKTTRPTSILQNEWWILIKRSFFHLSIIEP